MNMDYALGIVAGAVAVVLAYLSAPRQAWLAHPLRARPARLVAFASFCLALYALGRAMQFTVAVFCLLAWSMLLATLMPHLAALRAGRSPRRGRHE